MLFDALLIFGLGGLIGILVDLDHPTGVATGLDQHMAHKPFAYLCGIILGGSIACLGGLLLESILI